jgi:hypothetical protein|tara:strand:+ start:411 stop:683 length:273 start_codon:yes stop_codon:yes gene_type:complete
MAPGLGIGIVSVVESANINLGVLGGAFEANTDNDTFFEEDGYQNLQPNFQAIDNNSMWDLDGNTHIIPASSPSTEGWFETDGDGNNMPIA